MKPLQHALIVLILTSMAFQGHSQGTTAYQNPSNRMTTYAPKILTITYVRKPWYAWRSLIVKKFKESIPTYQAIPGLMQKNYHFTENHRQFGGLYLWATEAEARRWFNPAWFQRVVKTYGKEGIVDYYEVVESSTMATHELTGRYWSVLQLGKSLDFAPATPGLLRVTHIKNNDQSGTITLWTTKASALQFFSQQKEAGRLSYFDTPVLIDNLRQ